ncbi:MAG: AAA family ATPase [Bacteroidales bacterium]|nr:AAA family ATPase [Bacteroidales bacterium]
MEKDKRKVEILIDEIDIENFRGCKQETATFNGNDILISGRNKAGKSTIYEAYMWCIFRTCVSGTADNVQPRKQGIDGELGAIIHKLKTSVFVTLRINGEKYLFGRTLEENWSKPRGKEEEVLTGTTSEYYFNSREVPCGLATFKKHLDDICDLDIWYTCSNIDNFIRMKVNDRRDLLKSVSSCKSDYEIAENYPLVKKAFDEKKSIDEFKKEVSQSLTKVRNEYDSIPDQKNAQERLREVIDEEILNKEKQETEQAIKNIDDILQKNPQSDLFKTIQETNDTLIKYQSYLIKRQNEIKKSYDSRKEYLTNKVKDLENEKDLRINRIGVIKENVKTYNDTITDLESKIADAGRKWEEENQRVISVPERCDKCGNILTDEIKQKYFQEATNEKLLNLKRLEDFANENDKIIKQKQEIVKKANEEIIKKNNEIAKLTEDLKSVEQERDNLPNIVSLCAEDEECIKLGNSCLEYNDKLDTLKSQISTDNEDKTDELKAEKQAKQQRLEEINKELAKVDTNKRIDEEQAKLDDRAKVLVADMDVLEQKLKEINEFRKERINYIEKSVSSLFELTQFKMFEKNMTNDGEKDICTPYNNGVPYGEQNLGMQIAMGIDICNGIMKAIDCKFPLFIDNTESIFPLPAIIGQKILLKHIPDQSLFIQKL